MSITIILIIAICAVISNSLIYFFLALVHAENTLLGFLTYSAVDALRCIELARGEFLLVFHTLAVYVDSQGRKSRDREIMYPAVPTAVSKYDDRNLIIFNCTNISLFSLSPFYFILAFLYL